MNPGADDMLLGETDGVDCTCDTKRRPDCPEHGWDVAPEGSRLVTDLTTGEQHIEPPAPPVSVEEFLGR